MKRHIYDRMVRASVSRRGLLKGAGATGTLAALGGVSTGTLVRPAFADGHAALRAELLKIPGVGMGSPTDADWQKVGAMTLEATKQVVQEGEFAGVELTFMGLNNQNLHNFLFRGFLKPWEEYTGATISWIDLAQADYNARLQQAIATGTVDFDIIEMGAPFEGDVLGRGMAMEMPQWVADLIDMDDYVDYLKAPVGTWDGKTYRVSIDGDRHTLAYRKDLYASEELASAWGEEGDGSAWERPMTWEMVNAHSKFLAGKTDPLTGLPAHGFLDPLKGWGGFGFYFLEDRATPYAKHPDDPAWLFDPDTMKPRVNNPAFVQAIQDVMDLIEAGAYPADQINADPGTTAFQQFLAGTGGGLTWWGDVGSSARTSDTSVVGDVVGFDINPGTQRVYNAQAGAWEDTPNRSPNMAYIGWGVYVMQRAAEGGDVKAKAAWSAAAHLGGKDLSLWASAYPSGFQPYRNSHFQYEEWEEAGYDRDYVEDYLGSNLDSYNHPNAAIEPRIPGIFQYYSVAEDELAKGYAGQYGSAQETADAIAAAWEEITDQIGRESQIALYKGSLGM